jgi:2-polyprenyl-3-methyl-5-hydroxy-6-metoxy-1,4-benzoquinol methylase
MLLSEHFLYLLARLLYRKELAHSAEMKQARASREQYNAFRFRQLDGILSAASRYGVDIVGKTVLDLGCSDGAMTVGYVDKGAARVVGVDIDAAAIDRANARPRPSQVEFHLGSPGSIPLTDDSFDVIICYDVWEHVSQPASMLDECYRALKAGGKMLIGTWGWYHPFAPHLWATMPVPWAHVFFSERTILRVCRWVYQSPWYVPTMHDLDEHGQRRPNRYENDSISRDYLNKLFIRDFDRLFRSSRFRYEMHPQPFGSRLARWTKVFLRTPWLREFITGYLWVVLHKGAAR